MKKMVFKKTVLAAALALGSVSMTQAEPYSQTLLDSFKTSVSGSLGASNGESFKLSKNGVKIVDNFIKTLDSAIDKSDEIIETLKNRLISIGDQIKN